MLYFRQLKGHKSYAKPWIRDAPTVDYPEQNHRVNISTYLTKSNPFSLSEDSRRSVPEFRSGRSNSLKGASTGSILKVPGSPPRIGPSRSISFNEVDVCCLRRRWIMQIKLSELDLQSRGLKFSNTESSLRAERVCYQLLNGH